MRCTGILTISVVGDRMHEKNERQDQWKEKRERKGVEKKDNWWGKLPWEMGGNKLQKQWEIWSARHQNYWQGNLVPYVEGVGKLNLCPCLVCVHELRIFSCFSINWTTATPPKSPRPKAAKTKKRWPCHHGIGVGHTLLSPYSKQFISLYDFWTNNKVIYNIILLVYIGTYAFL